MLDIFIDKICRILIVMIIVLLLLFLCLCGVVILTHSVPTYEIAAQEYVEDNQSVYTISFEERSLLAKLAHAEGSVCSEKCQRDIVSVVFNRLESGKWRKDVNNDGKITIYDIIYYPNAFTPATNGAIDEWEPTEKDYRAVDYVIKNGSTLPREVRYFRLGYDFKWEGYKNYKVIDDTYFGYFENWENGAW